MPLVPHVAYASTSSSDHFNSVIDRTVQRFVDVAERDLQWPAATAGPGAVCRTIADGLMWTVVGGAWRQIGGGYEVAVGPADPYVADPASTDEWWYDTSTTPPQTKVRVAGAWRVVSLSDFGPPTANISMGDWLVQNVAGPPVDGTDAANKAYVDQMIAGLSWKEAVVTASAPGEDVDLAVGGLVTLDGFTPAAADRVLVKDQAFPENNGVYVAAAGPWVRAIDMDDPTELSSAAVFIANGLTQANTSWVSQSDDTLNLGTDPIHFTQFTGALPPMADLVAPLVHGGVATPGVSTNSSRGDHVHYVEHELPPGGLPGDTLAKIDATDYSVHWVTAQADEVWIGAEDPDVVEPGSARELWWDTDAPDVSAGSVPTGGLLGQPLIKLSDTDLDVGWDGPVNINGPLRTNNTLRHGHASHIEVLVPGGYGLKLFGGAHIYERGGTVLTLRETTGGAQPQIDNNDGTNPRDIIDTVNGDARYALKGELADTARTEWVPQGWQWFQNVDSIVYLRSGIVTMNLHVRHAPGINDPNLEQNDFIFYDGHMPTSMRPSRNIYVNGGFYPRGWTGGAADNVGSVLLRVNPGGGVIVEQWNSGWQDNTSAIICNGSWAVA